MAFQSTCPLRGTTATAEDWYTRVGFQSTCPLRGTTRQRQQARERKRFQSTCPLRGTTPASGVCKLGASDFNPRAPCGARRYICGNSQPVSKFQSTCPLRGTTRLTLPWFRGYNISIHVPLAGHDGC